MAELLQIINYGIGCNLRVQLAHVTFNFDFSVRQNGLFFHQIWSFYNLLYGPKQDKKDSQIDGAIL